MSKHIDWRQITRVFARIGILSFGGPAAQIALMHRELVEERPWLSEREYLSALSFCMLLPGPEAMQLATYSGWKLRGTLGGLIAGALFVLPGALVVFTLALAYASFGSVPLVSAMFLGIKATVIVIVVQALRNVAKKALTSTAHRVLAVLSFIAIFALNLPFPIIILLAAIWGALSGRGEGDPVAFPRGLWAKSMMRTLFWLVLWFGPIAVLWFVGADFLTDIALFFSRLAVVTFGGAYAVLAYMTQEVVGNYGWLTTAQMMDGLGLAETTPGPLILVTEFTGFLAGFGQGGIGLATAAALVTLWVTFIPCFLWIFLGAPYLDWISAQPRLTGALSAITAAVVGVIANLSLWFAIHVFFEHVTIFDAGPLAMPLPQLASIEPLAVVLCIIAAILTFVMRLSLPLTLLVMAILGAVSTIVF